MKCLCFETNRIKLVTNHNFIEITIQHGCSPVNLLHIFRTPFPKNTSAWLLLKSEMRYFFPYDDNIFLLKFAVNPLMPVVY